MSTFDLPGNTEAATPTESILGKPQQLSFWGKVKYTASRRYRKFLDDVTPFTYRRWAATGVLLLLYFLRVYLLQGFYIITYALGIYYLNLLLGFLRPKKSPSDLSPIDEATSTEDGATALPVSQDDEFKPFIRHLPEFSFWLSVTKALLIAIGCTFFDILDIPVFWPILLIYWLVLFIFSMKKQIMHMYKHKYVPWDFGRKPQYKAKK